MAEKKIIVLPQAREYLQTALSETERDSTIADLETLGLGDTTGIYIKKLRGKIWELVVGNHRLTYFGKGNIIYIVRGFRKKTQKTPVREIEYAEKIQKLIQ
jgi:phage-related protein